MPKQPQPTEPAAGTPQMEETSAELFDPFPTSARQQEPPDSSEKKPDETPAESQELTGEDLGKAVATLQKAIAEGRLPKVPNFEDLDLGDDDLTVIYSVQLVSKNGSVARVHGVHRMHDQLSESMLPGTVGDMDSFVENNIGKPLRAKVQKIVATLAAPPTQAEIMSLPPTTLRQPMHSAILDLPPPVQTAPHEYPNTTSTAT